MKYMLEALFLGLILLALSGLPSLFQSGHVCESEVSAAKSFFSNAGPAHEAQPLHHDIGCLHHSSSCCHPPVHVSRFQGLSLQTSLLPLSFTEISEVQIQSPFLEGPFQPPKA